MDMLFEDLSNYSDELIILGILIIAFVSFYSRYFKKK